MIPPRISNSLEADLGTQHNYTAGRGSSHAPVQGGTLQNNNKLFIKQKKKQEDGFYARVSHFTFFALKSNLLQMRSILAQRLVIV